jgi:hypothetical protein
MDTRQETFELDVAEWLVLVRGASSPPPRWLMWDFSGLPPDVAAGWAEHNEEGHEILQAVSRGEPITLRHACYLAGHFTAVNQRTGQRITSDELTRQLGCTRRNL